MYNSDYLTLGELEILLDEITNIKQRLVLLQDLIVFVPYDSPEFVDYSYTMYDEKVYSFDEDDTYDIVTASILRNNFRESINSDREELDFSEYYIPEDTLVMLEVAIRDHKRLSKEQIETYLKKIRG